MYDFLESRGQTLDYCIIPLSWVTFWTHSEIIPVGQFFRRCILRSRSFRLIDWLTDWLIDWVIDWLVDWLIDWRKVNFDLVGFIGLVPPDVLLRGGAEVTQHNGIIQYGWLVASEKCRVTNTAGQRSMTLQVLRKWRILKSQIIPQILLNTTLL